MNVKDYQVPWRKATKKNTMDDGTLKRNYQQKNDTKVEKLKNHSQCIFKYFTILP